MHDYQIVASQVKITRFSKYSHAIDSAIMQGIRQDGEGEKG